MTGAHPNTLAHHNTLSHHLTVTAGQAPGSVGVTFVDGRERETPVSWATLSARAQRAAGALHHAGVRPGDRVAIVLPTSIPFLDAVFGCHLIGAVPVPLYPPVRLGRIDEYVARTVVMLRTVHAVALISDKRVRRVLGRVVAAWPPRLGVITAETLCEGPARAPHPAQPDDLALIQFSSGTTVAPKAVALTHAQVLANVEAILEHVPAEPGCPRVGACWLPLYHDMGLIGCLFAAVRSAGALVLIPPEQFLAKPAIWLRAISRHRVTVSPAPNFAYALCAERIADDDLAGCDLRPWRLALNGAEPVAPASLRRFTERFSAFGLRQEALTPVYGLAEAALAVTFSAHDRPAQTFFVDRDALASGRLVLSDDGVELASVGTPLRGFAVEIRDAHDTPVPANTLGRIWVSGPSLMRGYLGDVPSPLRDGWLDTGDQGALLNGQLVVTGREKDIVILRGANHNPHDIERAVDTIDGVRTGCAVAVGDMGEHGERLLVFVEARAPRDALAEECRTAVRSATGLDPALVLVLAPGTLPRTSSGKLRRGEALSRFRADTLTPPRALTPLRVAGILAKSWWGHRTATKG